MKNFLRPSLTISQQKDKAKELLAKKQFKEAINAYKELLKSGSDQALNEKLAEAYRGRAHELASKDMHPEAILLWESQAKLIGQSPWDVCYVGWLFQAGQYTKLASQADTLTAALEPLGLARPVLETLAILALDDHKLLARFAPDHPIAKHQPILLKAMQAYSSGQTEILESCLQQIPSRSPYREVRTLLKSLAVLEQDRNAGLDLLNGIAGHSIVKHLAKQLQQQVSGQGVDVQTYPLLSGKLQALINKLNGYGKNQLDLLRNLKKLNQNPSSRVLFEFAIHNRQALGETAANRFCKAMLFDYSEGLKLYERHFAALPVAEKIRLQALLEESEGEYQDAFTTWQQYIEQIRATAHDSGDEGHIDQIEALIWRHFFKLIGEFRSPQLLQLLVRSLELDPVDRQSFIHLIEGYQSSDPKESLAWLEKALVQFPRDLDFLTRAMHAAAERKAFKKAASYARAILKTDSLNSAARLFLVEAHLGHARKQFKAGRLDLAQQEIRDAHSLDPYERNSQIFYLEGIMAGRSGHAESAVERLGKGLSIDRQNNLAAHLGYLVEIHELGISKRSKELAVIQTAPQYVPSRHDMDILLAKIKSIPKGQASSLFKALQALSSVIVKGAASLDVHRGEYSGLCQVFLDMEAYDLLLKFCKRLSLPFQFNSPILLELYQLLASCRGDLAELGMMQGMRFSMIQLQVQQSNDPEALRLVNRFLGRALTEMRNQMEEDEPDEYDDEFDEVDPDSLSSVQRAELFVRDVEIMQDLSDEEIRLYLTEIQGKKPPRNTNRLEMEHSIIDYLKYRYNVTRQDIEKILGPL